MTRAEHLQWAKDRALALVDEGDLTQAYASMVSDLGKHEKLAGHDGLQLGMILLVSGHLDTSTKMMKFINDFN